MKTIAITKIEEVENDHNPRLGRSIEHAIMKKQVLLIAVLALGSLAVMLLVPVRQAAQRARASHPRTLFAPPSSKPLGQPPSSIQSTVDAFRAALDNPNNNNNTPPLASGHREINWDGGNTANVDPLRPP